MKSIQGKFKKKKPTDLLTTSFQPSSLFWPLLGLVRLSLLLGDVTGRAIDLNGEGKELEVESTASGVLWRWAKKHYKLNLFILSIYTKSYVNIFMV